MSGAHKEPFTYKRKRFVAEYLKDLNATRAAERAGYKHPNVMGPRLVKVREIRQEIDEHLRAKIMTSEEILGRLTDQAKTDYNAYIKSDGSIDLPKLLADGKGHLIKGIRRDRDGDPIIDFYDGQKALSLMAKHRGLLNDKITNINVDLNSLTAEQLERVAAGEDPAHVLATTQSDNSNDE